MSNSRNLRDYTDLRSWKMEIIFWIHLPLIVVSMLLLKFKQAEGLILLSVGTAVPLAMGLAIVGVARSFPIFMLLIVCWCAILCIPAEILQKRWRRQEEKKVE